MDSRLRGNDDSSVHSVIPAKAGIHESQGGRGTSMQARIAELEARLTWRLLAIAAAIVAAVKIIPPAY